MILHLVRHPRPRVEAGICYGQLDLVAENVEAAADALRPRLLSGLPVWSSPLQRCRHLAEALHPSPRLDVRLAEINFGDWEGRPWDAIPRQQIDAWASDVAHFVPPGGESPFMLQQRALDFVAGLVVPEAVLVTHAGVIRVLLAHWRNLPPEHWSELVFDYGSLTTVELPR